MAPRPTRMRCLPACLAVAVLAVSRGAAAAELGYYGQPALHGRHLVFASEGDLWTATLPLEGTGPIIAYRLTSGDGDEARPVFSTDGRWIAFTGEYEGNADVYVMAADGGAPARLTFHPGADVALDWTPDGRWVLFRSPRASPTGRDQLWRVSAAGGMPQPYGFGECSLVSLSSTGRRIAFTRWSNENWTWKRYRGGTAPEIWIGDLDTSRFSPLTDDTANDLFPMWLLGRVYFLSDRTGTANIFSDRTDGGDLQQHTTFAPRPGEPTALDGYDVRWPSADAQQRGGTIVFCQAGGLALLDVPTNAVTRLDVRLASDRVALRRRFADPMETAVDYRLTDDGSAVLVDARGEILSYPTDDGPPRQLTHTSAIREWGAGLLGADQMVLVTDATGEQEIAIAPLDGSALPSLLTDQNAAWLFPPVGSPDGQWVAFADKTQRLHLLNTETLNRKLVDASEAWEITDYRFSPDSQWLAYVKPVPNGYGTIHIYSLRTGRSFAVSDGLHDDAEPRWDPAGKYLFFLSKRQLNPVMGQLDFEHVYINATGVYAVPLAAATPPPVPEAARAAGFDMDSWAQPPEVDDQELEELQGQDDLAGGDAPAEPMLVDAEGLDQRQYVLAVEPGNYSRLEALWGQITFLSEPPETLLDDDDEDLQAGLGKGRATLMRHDIPLQETEAIAREVSGYQVSGDRFTLAYPAEDAFVLVDMTGAEEPWRVETGGLRLRIDVPDEWKQIFDEAWRLQRDFYWAPNYVGVDWPAMREKYAALLPRVGTRDELNRVIGEMIGELSTSHTYIWGGQQYDPAEPVSVGMLGAEIEFDGRAFRLTRILPRFSWSPELDSPLAAPHLGVKEGDMLLAINGVALGPRSNVYDLLQDQADKLVDVTVADGATGADKRTVTVRALPSETELRYADWVQRNWHFVDEASGGAIGYVHIPDMGGHGLVVFSRLFYPQIQQKALVVDIRDNGGGFVSQMIIERLNRKVWAFMKPRHGMTERYPQKSLYGHMAVLIDQFAGSDGDIFPESFRLNDMGPLIGTRTWGGVIGIRADKPFVDMGMSTQPEFAWWEPKRGWSLENNGVTPDIEVTITPNDRLAGRDPQLEKAIEVLKQKLTDDPKELPEPPPWPVRTGGN